MKRTLAVIAALVVIAILIWRPPSAGVPIAVASPQPVRTGKHVRRLQRSTTIENEVVVYVAGEVAHPGLYHLRSGARADDAVRIAGGFRSGADTGAINLAAHVADGDEVYVAVLGEPTAHPTRAGRSRRALKVKKNATGVVDLNTASAEQLAMIPGVGATLAARIVEVRERDGAYGTFDELLDVAGMTASRLARVEPYLRI